MSPEENATIHHAATIPSPNTNFVLFNSIMPAFFIFICVFVGPQRDRLQSGLGLLRLCLSTGILSMSRLLTFVWR